MSGGDDADRQHDPSERRLEEARRKGEVPRSAELTAAAGLGGLTLALMIWGAAIAGRTAELMAGLLATPDLTRAAGGLAALRPALASLALTLAPLFLLPAALALVCLVAQRAIVVAPSRLAPKASRLSPLATARQKFGTDGLVEFARSVVKVLLLGVILALFLRARWGSVAGAAALQPGQVTGLMAGLLLTFLVLMVVAGAAFGAVDMVWQWFAHRRRNRMTRQEVTDEHKESEGDPHTKAQRRQRGVEIATNRMIADVPRADVVIVNPTHYAVALKWDRASRGAPVLVAKGTDAVAARIREAAALAGVPLHSDPPTARALHATVEIGQTIRPEHYRAVAAAIRFAERMRKRAGARR